jgi:hypothetical protein
MLDSDNAQFPGKQAAKEKKWELIRTNFEMLTQSLQCVLVLPENLSALAWELTHGARYSA